MSFAARSVSHTRLAVAGLIAGAGLCAGGCVTNPGYVMRGGVDGSWYGYSDRRNVDGSYTIRVDLPASTSNPQIAYTYWNRRAEELCGGAFLRKSIHTAERPVVFVQPHQSHQAIRGDYVLEGYVYCETPAETPPPDAPAAG